MNMVTLAIFILTFVCSVSGQSTCPGRIGRNDTTTGNAERADRFYINRGDPATCNGIITSFSYCYFRPNAFNRNDIDDYVTPIAVYRPQDGDRYTAVSQTIQLRKRFVDVEAELDGANFVCSVLILDQPVTVQSGDVLGACVGNVNSRDDLYPFDIVGQPGQGVADGDLLRQVETRAGCTATSVPSDINVSGYSANTGVLYLSANILATIALTGCPSGPDDTEWRIDWPVTERNTFRTQSCSVIIPTFSGKITRYCDGNGDWSEPNALGCQDMEFIGIQDQLQSLLDSQVSLEQTADLTLQLYDLTVPTNVSLLPSSISIINEILTKVIDVLAETMGNTTNGLESVVDVVNNILDTSNSQGWIDLLSDSSNMGESQMLLNNAERVGILLAQTRNKVNKSSDPVRLSRANIAISAKQYDDSQKSENLRFPNEQDLANFTTPDSIPSPALVQIPPKLLDERLNLTNATAVPVVFIIFQNLASFLPASTEGFSNNTRGLSVVVSAQVGESTAIGSSLALEESPINLTFSFETTDDIQEHRCVFWKFSQPVGSGCWDNTGVKTTRNTTKGLLTTVECTSTHLTSFAVLVDVAGALQNISRPAETKALEIVSYIGCAISVVCLITAVIFFLLQGKKLFQHVNYFVHLNLALSLLLAYLAFIVGIETARTSAAGCAFVAALLHYLFLCVFCWMLCEGVMLYLMLVVVFSRLAKAWWFFLLLGYLLPLPFVVITLIVRWQYYGVRDQDGRLAFCWLSVDEGTIFGFVAPMILIILINLIFMVFAFKTLWESKKSTAQRRLTKDNKVFYSLQVVKSLLLATVILLPLLGITWVFGLLTINSDTTVFAWAFTISNSLQGAALLFFHVVRSEEVQAKIGKCCTCKKKQPSSKSVATNRSEIFPQRSNDILEHKKIDLRQFPPENTRVALGQKNPLFQTKDDKRESKKPQASVVMDDSDLIEVNETLFELRGSVQYTDELETWKDINFTDEALYESGGPTQRTAANDDDEFNTWRESAMFD